MYNDVTGIILAGGKSTRMGEDKSFLKLDGMTIIEHILNRMKSVFQNVFIVSNSPEDYRELGVPIYRDIYEFKGPLAGIHSGLKYSKTRENFIISVDMPLMTKDMIEYLVDYETDKPVTVCHADGFVQQLAGRYSSSVFSVAEQILERYSEESGSVNQVKRKCAVLTLLDITGAEIIDSGEVSFYKPGMFFNMNRPEDYNYILSKFEKK